MCVDVCIVMIHCFPQVWWQPKFDCGAPCPFVVTMIQAHVTFLPCLQICVSTDHWFSHCCHPICVYSIRVHPICQLWCAILVSSSLCSSNSFMFIQLVHLCIHLLCSFSSCSSNLFIRGPSSTHTHTQTNIHRFICMMVFSVHHTRHIQTWFRRSAPSAALHPAPLCTQRFPYT